MSFPLKKLFYTPKNWASGEAGITPSSQGGDLMGFTLG